MVVLISKSFNETDKLTDFVNQNLILKKDIQQITSDSYKDYLFYWGDALHALSETKQDGGNNNG